MLREYRKRMKISQEELEKITNIDRKTIFRIENDISLPLLETFSKLALALNMTDKEIAKEIRNIGNKKAE